MRRATEAVIAACHLKWSTRAGSRKRKVLSLMRGNAASGMP